MGCGFIFSLSLAFNTFIARNWDTYVASAFTHGTGKITGFPDLGICTVYLGQGEKLFADKETLLEG
jgi:hypothetical protein